MMTWCKKSKEHSKINQQQKKKKKKKKTEKRKRVSKESIIVNSDKSVDHCFYFTLFLLSPTYYIENFHFLTRLCKIFFPNPFIAI